MWSWSAVEAWERSSLRPAGEAGSEGRLKLLPAERSAAVDGRLVALTAQEFQVLQTLARRPGEVLGAADLRDAYSTGVAAG